MIYLSLHAGITLKTLTKSYPNFDGLPIIHTKAILGAKCRHFTTIIRFELDVALNTRNKQINLF